MVGGSRSVRSRRWLGTAAFALLLGALPATPAYAAGGSVTGLVTDSAGSALADVCVHLSQPQFYGRTVAEARTAADGTYTANVAAGTYHVVFTDCGGRDLVKSYWQGATQRYYAKPVTVADGQQLTGIDGRLAAGGSISGRVTDTAGAPLAGVGLDLTARDPTHRNYPEEESPRTDADGRFHVRGLPPGSYLLEFFSWDTRYARSMFYGDTPDAPQSPEVVVTAGAATTGLDARLPLAATISGVVRDDSGAPFELVCVRAVASLSTSNTFQHTARTGADGSYVIERLAAGTYRVEFNDCGGVTASSWYPKVTSFAAATPVTVAEGAAVTGIDGTYSRGLHIAGRVLDTAGQPLRHISIALYDGRTGSFTGRQASTDADGRFSVPGVRASLYKLMFYASGDDPDRVTRWWPGVPSQAAALPVSTVGSVSVDDLVMVLPHGGRIAGTVTDPAGDPTRAMCVYATNPLTEQSGGGRPGLDGRYEIRGLDTGTYHVSFRSCGTDNLAPAYYGGTHDRRTADLVTVAVEETTGGIDHRATPGGIITGRVTDTAGAPLAHMCVLAGRYGGGNMLPGYSATDADGRYVIHSLPPHSDYWVSAADCWSTPRRYVEGWNGGATSIGEAPPVAASAGRTTALEDIALELGGSFSGTVTDQFGQPLDRVCLNAVDAGGSARGAMHTHQTGMYSLGGLRPGRYRAVFSDCGAGLVSNVWYGDSRSMDGAVSFYVREGEDTPEVDVSVDVYTTPGVPLGVGAEAADSAAVVSWRPPSSDGFHALTAYEVRSSSGSLVARVGASARSAVVRGLANGTTYAFTVNAVNVKGAGDKSPPVSVVPRPFARLSVAAPSVVVSDAPATVSGRLLTPSGAALGGARVELLGRRLGSTSGMTRYSVTTTSSTGSYRFAISPATPTEYAVRWAGSASLAPTKVLRAVPVAPRVRWSVSGRSVAVVVAPAGGGGRARLQVRRTTGWVSVVGADLSSLGRATLRAPSAGTYRVIVVRRGWATAAGSSFGLS